MISRRIKYYVCRECNLTFEHNEKLYIFIRAKNRKDCKQSLSIRGFDNRIIYPIHRMSSELITYLALSVDLRMPTKREKIKGWLIDSEHIDAYINCS
jgi:hypothetical protein